MDDDDTLIEEAVLALLAAFSFDDGNASNGLYIPILKPCP